MSLQSDNSKHTPGMYVHFTYKPEADKNSLCQGDVLEITEELSKALKDVHPYFQKEQYKFFMVLSQSCDLVRRNGKNCKTPYITLAVVRSYADFLRKTLLSGKYAEEVNNFLLMDEKNKERAYQLIERVYNNTEPEYFFLYKENALEFEESMVAYLKVSIALKSSEHYEKCLHAKKLELADEFKAKLGWLVGNMYSRVGTADWEGIMPARQKKDMLHKDLHSMCIIGNKEQLKQLKTLFLEEKDFSLNREEAAAFISNMKVKTKYDNVMKIIEDVIQKSGLELAEDKKTQLLNSIRSNNELRALIK